MFRKIATAIVALTLITGVSAAAVAAGQPPEDSRNFNCAKHGNRVCGVYLDATPNNGKRDGKWYVLNFETKTFKPRGF